METTYKKLADRITKGEVNVIFHANKQYTLEAPDSQELGKPTAFSIDYATDKANASLIKEAFAVTNETGLSPRELKEQRDEATEIIRIITGLDYQGGFTYNNKHYRGADWETTVLLRKLRDDFLNKVKQLA